MMAYNNIANYYKTIFGLVQFHKYSITEIEALFPFERDLYIEMLLEHLEDQKSPE